MSTYPGMKPAGRLAEVVSEHVNPRNKAASAARRAKLLAAFDSLDENIRADLLEAAESLVFNAGMGVSLERDDARGIFRQMYVAAGWEQSC